MVPGPGQRFDPTADENAEYWCVSLTAENLDPSRNNGKPPYICPVGNPINPATGNKFQRENDFTVPSPFPISFTRYYNSEPTYTSMRLDLGTRWTHEYQRYIDKLSTTKVVLRRQDGRAFIANLSGGQWGLSSDAPGKLNAAGSGWMFINENRERELYDSSGFLKSITDAAGNILTFDINTKGQPTKIKDQFNNIRVTLAYNGDGSIGNVFIPQSGAGGIWYSYHYSSQRLYSVVFPDSNDDGTSGTRGNNPYREYLYAEPDYMHDEDDGPLMYPGALTGIQDRDRPRYATFRYDSHGRAWSSEHAGGVDSVTLDFQVQPQLSGSTVVPGSTVVTDALDREAIQEFTAFHGEAKSLSVSGEGRWCGNGSAASEYDSAGLLKTSTDYRGNITRYAHNSSKLEICRLEGIPPTSSTSTADKAYRLITTPLWNTTFRKPTLVKTWEPINPSMTSPTSCPIEPDTGVWRLRSETELVLDSASGQILERIERSYPTSTDDPERKTTYQYYDNSGSDAFLVGMLRQIDGPLLVDAADVIEYQYVTTVSAPNHPNLGDLWKVIRNVNSSFSITTEITKHDAFGRPLEIVENNGALTKILTYHPRGWLSSQTITGKTTYFDYNDVGKLDLVTLPDSSTLDYVYDDAYRLTDVFDNAGNHIHYDLDLLGNRTQENICTAPVCNLGNMRHSLQRVFNARNELGKLLNGNGTTTNFGYKYDLNGNLRSIVDPRDPDLNAEDPLPETPTIAAHQQFDALDRLRLATDPLAGETVIGHDVFDNVTSIRDANGSSTTYSYNAFGNMRSQVSPDTGISAYTHDTAGNLISTDDARSSEATTQQFDALGRLTRINYPSSPAVVLTYDETGEGQNGVGRLTRVSDQSGESRYKYDARGNLQQITAQFDGQPSRTYSVGYEYDDADRPYKIRYPSNRTVTFTRAANGEVASVSTTHLGVTNDVATSVAHAPFGPVTGFTFGGGSSTQTFSRSLDWSYRVTGITDSALPTLGYSYHDGTTNTPNITQITETGLTTQSFTYDWADRLLTAVGTYGSHNYAQTPYDWVGNRTSTTINTVTQSYSLISGTNRLESVSSGGPAFTYDAVGNALSRDETSFAYAQDGRLKRATLGGTLIGAYAHNYQGQRTKKQADGRTTYFVYGSEGELLAEINGDGTVNREYVYLEGMPIALLTPETITDYDGDDDGMSDLWEVRHGLDPNDDSDAATDADEDGLSNLDEAQEGTDPHKADTDGDGIVDDVDTQPLQSSVPSWIRPILDLMAD